MFSETFFQAAAAIAEEHFAERPPVDEALAMCLGKLPHQDRELVRLKYGERVSLTNQAEASDRKANTVHKTLSRIRLVLRECIRRQMDSDSPRSA